MTYIIPFKKRPIIVGQGFNGVSHKDWPEDNQDWTYSVDFILPEETELIASHSGVVVALKIDGKENYSGEDIKKGQIACEKWMNELVMEHSDGTYAAYAHLKHKSSFVKVGDKVKQGQVIGLSGNTGWSSEPHLHFSVFRVNYKGRRNKTIEFKFKDYSGTLEDNKLK